MCSPGVVSAVQESEAGYLVVLVAEDRERDGEHGRHLPRAAHHSAVRTVEGGCGAPGLQGETGEVRHQAEHGGGAVTEHPEAG